MTKNERHTIFSPGSIKIMNRKDAPGESRAKTAMEFLELISMNKPSRVVVVEANHQKTTEYGLLAQTARDSLHLDFELILYKSSNGGLPEVFDKQIREAGELSSI